MFERFTDRARRVLVLAQEEARQLDHSFIGTEHILLGLIHEGEGIAAKALEQLGIQLQDVRERVEEVITLSGSAPMTGSPPFTPRAKKVLELALRECHQLGHNYIGTEHILLGIVREGEGVGAQVLLSLGGESRRVRQKVVELLSGAGGVVNRVRPISSTGGEVFGTRSANLVACSFCGRRPPDTGQIVSGADAYICEHCVREWAARLGQLFAPDEPSRTAYIYRPVEHTGPPPEDGEAASAEIAAAFAEHGTVSDDGQDLPHVEGGENLGSLLGRARERHREVIHEGAVVTTTVEQIAFIDSEHAAVWFTVSVDGRPLLQSRRGDAVVADGGWKMARSTFCHLMSLAGVECPPLGSGLKPK